MAKRCMLDRPPVEVESDSFDDDDDELAAGSASASLSSCSAMAAVSSSSLASPSSRTRLRGIGRSVTTHRTSNRPLPYLCDASSTHATSRAPRKMSLLTLHSTQWGRARVSCRVLSCRGECARVWRTLAVAQPPRDEIAVLAAAHDVILFDREVHAPQRRRMPLERTDHLHLAQVNHCNARTEGHVSKLQQINK